MIVITSDRHEEEDRLRWRVSSNCLCHKGSKSKQKSSMSQKMGRMSMKRTPCRSRDEVLVNYILQLGVLFSISYVELTLNYIRSRQKPDNDSESLILNSVSQALCLQAKHTTR